MYTPVNVDTYTNAYAGALAGMAVSGWIIDPNSSDYANVSAIAGAFAEAFDTVWNNAATLNWLQIQSIQSVCQEQFRGHAPGSLDNATFAQAANWAVPAAACAALVLEGDAYVTSQGITPNTPGGGGGGGALLTATWFVDNRTTIPLASQTGAIGAPFGSLAQAIAAAQADFTANIRDQTIWVTPGDYAAEGAQTLNVPGKALAVVNWQLALSNPTALLPDLTVDGDLILTAISLGIVNVNGFLVTVKAQVTTANAAALQAYQGSLLQGGIITNQAEFYNSVPFGNWTAATAVFVGCTLAAPVNVTGDVKIDSYTNAWQQVVASGVLQVIDKPAQWSGAVAVPAVGAGNVGYVDTVLGGELTNTPQDTPIVGNPHADLAAAGAGGGFINCRVSAAGTVRCAFLGPIAGGNVVFTFALLRQP